MNITKNSEVRLDDIEELVEALHEDIPFHTVGCPYDCPLYIAAERLLQFRDLIRDKK